MTFKFNNLSISLLNQLNEFLYLTTTFSDTLHHIVAAVFAARYQCHCTHFFLIFSIESNWNSKVSMQFYFNVNWTEHTKSALQIIRFAERWRTICGFCFQTQWSSLTIYLFSNGKRRTRKKNHHRDTCNVLKYPSMEKNFFCWSTNCTK